MVVVSINLENYTALKVTHFIHCAITLCTPDTKTINKV